MYFLGDEDEGVAGVRKFPNTSVGSQLKIVEL